MLKLYRRGVSMNYQEKIENLLDLYLAENKRHHVEYEKCIALKDLYEKNNTIFYLFYTSYHAHWLHNG